MEPLEKKVNLDHQDGMDGLERRELKDFRVSLGLLAPRDLPAQWDREVFLDQEERRARPAPWASLGSLAGMDRGGFQDLRRPKVLRVNLEFHKLGLLDHPDREDQRVRRVFWDPQGRLAHLGSKDCKAFQEKREIKASVVWMVSQDSTVRRESPVQ